MTIALADESAYRQKMRRRLTLDLFTRYGTFWEAIAKIRDEWQVTPDTAVPPEPDFHAGIVGLLTMYQMPERFHMPASSVILSTDENEIRRIDQKYGIEGMDDDLRSRRAVDQRLNVSFFLKALGDVWKAEAARPRDKDGDWRNGGNVSGWMSWAPFLSACVMYDPPADELLEYAEHDDNKANVVRMRTFSQDGDVSEEAVLHKVAFMAGDVAAVRRYGDTLRKSFIESNVPVPRGARGRPSDDLQDVQCAIWRHQGMSSATIGRRIERKVRDNSIMNKQGAYPSRRERSDAAEAAVNRGRAILDARQAWARITDE